MAKSKEPMTSEEYARQGGPACPYCRSKNIEGHQHDYSAEYVYQNIVCLDCGKEWTDVYKLIGYEPVEVPK